MGNGTLTLAGTNGYSGNTTVSGGTLKLTNTLTGASTTDPLLYMSFDNISGATVINLGVGGPAMNGSLVGGAAIVPGGRYGNALSIPGGNQGISYVLVNNPVTALSFNSTWTVAMWIKATTAGGCYMYKGSGAFGTGDISFYLNPATGAVGSGSHAGGVQNSGGWVGGTANINDGNWHFVVMTDTAGNRTNYVDGAVDALLVNQWNKASTVSQIRIGGNSASEAAGDGVVGLNGLIDEVYIYNRALSQTEIQNLALTPSGPTDIGTALPTTTSVSVAPPAKLDLNGSTASVTGLTGSGTVDTTLASGTLFVNASSDVVFDGTLTNTAGTLSLTKIGAAKLTLTGTNVHNGTTTVNAGTLNITGSLEPVVATARRHGYRQRCGKFLRRLPHQLQL